MITEKDLQEAIAECQGERNPNANTCIKLAAYYTILDNIKEKDPIERIPVSYSYDPPEVTAYTSDTLFGSQTGKKDPMKVMALMDELMDALQLYDPKLYEATMRKLASL